MVGVPRSTGCIECVKLRVKCDEERPSCQRCKRFGKVCPGYDRPLKFVHGLRGGHRVKPHGSECEPKSFSSTRPIMLEDKNLFSKTTETDPADSCAAAGTVIKHRCLLPREVPSRELARDQMFSIFLHDAFPHDKPGSAPRPMQLWLSSVPKRLRNSKAVDDALCSLVMHHTGCATSQIGLTLDGRKAYGKALRSLQSAIDKSSEADLTQIVCATSLLSVYELFACTDPDAWVAHANGMARLIQWRGVGCYQDPANEFDRTMLRAFWGQMVMQNWISAAFLQNTECFLSASEWQSALMTPDASDLSIPNLHDELHNYMAQLPGIKSKGMKLTFENDERKRRVLFGQAIRLNEALDEWHERLQQIAEPIKLVRSQEMHAMDYPHWTDLPMSYQFADPAIGPLWSEYHASKIILNNLLSRSGNEHQDMKSKNAWHAEEVCKATHNCYLSFTGLFGPYHFATALRIAYLFAGTPETKSWLQGLSSVMAKAMEVMRFPTIQSKDKPPADQ